MSRRRRHTLIFGSVALLTITALLMAYAPVGAWGRLADTRSDTGLSEVPLEGKTFRVLYKTSCSGSSVTSDTWQFLAGGELIGRTIYNGRWSQQGPLWNGHVAVTTCGVGFDLLGLSLGPAVVGVGTDATQLYSITVVGIVIRPEE